MRDIIEPRLSLAVTIIVFAGLTLRCITPPNPNTTGWKKDRIGFFATTTFTNAVGAAVVLLYIWHIALVCTWPLNIPQPLSELMCAHPEQLNEALFTWNKLTALSLLATILVGAPLRLGAYNSLGRNFTYGLAAPDKLTTDGFYRYIQHPGYSGLIIVITSVFTMFLRWDGVTACWIPASFYNQLQGWGLVTYAFVILAFTHRIAARIHDEEAMLKEVFGAEWDQWRRQTARFIPFVF